MKKILSGLLVFALILSMALSLSGCNLVYIIAGMMMEKEENEKPKNVFTCFSAGDELALTFPGEYSDYDHGSYYELFYDGYSIMIDPMAVSSFTPHDGRPRITLEEFSEFIAYESHYDNSVSPALSEHIKDGNHYYFNESNEEATIYSFCFESANSFWWVQCKANLSKVSSEEALATFQEFIGAITITDATEE